jgi:hypothetical protein
MYLVAFCVCPYQLKHQHFSWQLDMCPCSLLLERLRQECLSSGGQPGNIERPYLKKKKRERRKKIFKK